MSACWRAIKVEKQVRNKKITEPGHDFEGFRKDKYPHTCEYKIQPNLVSDIAKNFQSTHQNKNDGSDVSYFHITLYQKWVSISYSNNLRQLIMDSHYNFVKWSWNVTI